MSITVPQENIQAAVEQQVLTAWHEAHGADAGTIHTSWGEDRVVVMIEDVLLKGERLIAQSEAGKAVLDDYVEQLLTYVVVEQSKALSKLLQRKIINTSISTNTAEQWVMIVFRLED